jgi:hypothetical protein
MIGRPWLWDECEECHRVTYLMRFPLRVVIPVSFTRPLTPMAPVRTPVIQLCGTCACMTGRVKPRKQPA